MRPIVLIILDGWGYSNQKVGNAILEGSTPTMDLIKSNFPQLLLQASGKAVGLEWGEAGNSEAGHLTIGAGRIIFQYSTRINKAIESGEFYKNPGIKSAFQHAQKYSGAVHLIGLLGSGTVHSSMAHIVALTEMAKKEGMEKVFLHVFTDGKDSGLKESEQLLPKLQNELTRIGVGKIGTIIGRNAAMDRDNNWLERTKVAYDLYTSGSGTSAPDYMPQIQEQHNKVSDVAITPLVVDPSSTISDNDALIFFNFREDSIRQLAAAFADPNFNKFPKKDFKNLHISLMTQYFELSGVELHVAFPPPAINNGLAEVVSEVGKKQLHIAESEKYAHVTYFFNCLRNAPFEGESDELIESVKHAIEHPEMRAKEIADKFLFNFNEGTYDFTVINFANADILAHTGNLEAATKGVGHIDQAMGRILQAVLEKNGIMVITADHGNAESLIYKGTGEAESKHNLNPVPFFLIASEYQKQQPGEPNSDAQGLISDVAPTILELMQIEKPADMTGDSLLRLII